MAKSTTSVLADHYKALGREEKAHAIRTWLEAVRAELTKTPLRETLHEKAERTGAIAIIGVLLDRMNEASDAAPAAAVTE